MFQSPWGNQVPTQQLSISKEKVIDFVIVWGGEYFLFCLIFIESILLRKLFLSLWIMHFPSFFCSSSMADELAYVHDRMGELRRGMSGADSGYIEGDKRWSSSEVWYYTRGWIHSDMFVHIGFFSWSSITCFFVGFHPIWPFAFLPPTPRHAPYWPNVQPWVLYSLSIKKTLIDLRCFMNVWNERGSGGEGWGFMGVGVGGRLQR